MHQIKDTELTTSERYFIDNSLALIENTFSAFVDFHVDVENIDHYFASALGPTNDAQELVIEANSNGGDLIDQAGNSIDVDFKLATAEMEYANFVIEIKRSLYVVKGLNAILDAARHVAEGKTHEYSNKVSELQERVTNALKKINWCIESEQGKSEKRI